ncbi:MAG: DNA polymerase I [bacterium]
MTEKRLAIIDFYSLLYRAFFALPLSLTNKQGKPTNAVYGLVTMILKLIDDIKPDYLVVATDLPEVTHRKEAFDAYKAHRKPMPDEMRPQIAMAHELLDAMHIPIFSVAKEEADDVMGALAKIAEKINIKSLIVTSDRDLMQLVNDNIHVLTTKKGMSETAIYDRDAVIEKFGVPPESIPDWKALTGDSSDNIPGVPGIGEKTATKLLNEYGTLENLLDNKDKVPGKNGLALATYEEQARQSKKLATIKTEIDLTPPDFSEFSYHEWDNSKLFELFTELNFRSLLSRLSHDETLVNTQKADTSEFSGITIIKDEKDAAAILKLMQEENIGLFIPINTLEDKLAGMILATEKSGAFLQLRQSGGAMTSLFDDTPGETSVLPDKISIMQKFNTLLADSSFTAVTWAGKNLITLLKHDNIDVKCKIFDLELAKYLLDPTSRPEMAQIIREVNMINIEAPAYQAWWRANEFERITADNTIKYLLPMAKQFSAELIEKEMNSLYWDIEEPVMYILAEMEMQGIALETKSLLEISHEMAKTIDTIEREVFDIAGEQFVINSPKQLQVILYEKLKLAKGKKTKTGFSTDADHLITLADSNEIVQKILKYREMTKLKSTYVDSLPKLVHADTKRIHTHFNQTVAATGRLSSSDPNLQNIPIRTAEGREIRRCFIPSKPGWMLVAADYSQIELRVLAHITGDEAMTEVFIKGEDLHTAAACKLYNVSPDAVTREMRRIAKIINFSIPYGTTAYGLSTQIRSSQEVAAEFRNNYLARFPGVKKYMTDVVEQTKIDKYVTTILGRRRLIPEINSPVANVRQAAERTAINTPIQGSAADIMKLAMIHLHKEITVHPEIPINLLLQVHDELVVETPVEYIDVVSEILHRTMENAYTLSVPLVVEVKEGPNWRDVTPHVEELPIFNVNN